MPNLQPKKRGMTKAASQSQSRDSVRASSVLSAPSSQAGPKGVRESSPVNHSDSEDSTRDARPRARPRAKVKGASVLDKPAALTDEESELNPVANSDIAEQDQGSTQRRRAVIISDESDSE